MKPTILCYPKCGTCKKAEKWLKENNIMYDYRPIKEENPSAVELKKWIKQSNLSINSFFNTSGKLYRENNIKDKLKLLTNDELISILASDGMMVKRPVLIHGNTVLVGFKETEWAELFKSSEQD